MKKIVKWFNDPIDYSDSFGINIRELYQSFRDRNKVVDKNRTIKRSKMSGNCVEYHEHMLHNDGFEFCPYCGRYL